MTVRRIVVLGADAAGMSAAHQALRSARAKGADIEVIALEKSTYTSYSACGLPYWIAGDIDDFEELVARGPEQHRTMGVDLRTGVTVTALDVNRRTVTFADQGGEGTLTYDDLVIATGARAICPDWMYSADRTLIPGVAPVKNPEDAQTWIDRLAAGPARSVAVVGGGYIGVEMAEAARRRGHDVTLLTRSRVMSSLDPEMSDQIEKELVAAGVRVVTGTTVAGLSTDASGNVAGVVDTAGNVHSCGLVVAALGVTPALDFVPEGCLPQGPTGGLRATPDGRVADNIWAAGDCCESRHRLTGDWVYLPLGTHANKQGRIVGHNLFGAEMEFGGVLGTAITRFAGDGALVEISRTGLSSREAAASGFAVEALSTTGRTASGYMPEASTITTRIIADRTSRRLLGVQIVGGLGAAKRIDTAAAALWGGLTIDELAGMDLAYAPPFATVWEAVQLAARRLADRI